MKPDLRLLLFFVAIPCFTGCQDSHEKAARDSIRIMKELTAVVEGVEDNASAKLAAGKLVELKARSEALNTRIRALGGEPSQEVAIRLKEHYEASIEELKPRVREFGSKLEKYPELFEMMDEIMKDGAPRELKGLHLRSLSGNRDGYSQTAQLKSIEQAIMMYKLETGSFPKSLNDLSSLPTGMSQDKWGGPFLDKPVTHDLWGTNLKYSASEQDDKVSLFSAGPDKTFDTEDDVRN